MPMLDNSTLILSTVFDLYENPVNFIRRAFSLCLVIVKYRIVEVSGKRTIMFLVAIVVFSDCRKCAYQIRIIKCVCHSMRTIVSTAEVIINDFIIAGVVFLLLQRLLLSWLKALTFVTTQLLVLLG